MNTLIIGGLFAVALLAIVGLVFLLRSEPQTPKKASVTKVDNEPSRVSETAQIATGGLPTQPSLPSPKEETVVQQTVPAPQSVQRFPVANGQFHKLSVELHALQVQAQEIEHSLSTLTEMIEHVEQDQSHYINVDEVVSHPTESVSAN